MDVFNNIVIDTDNSDSNSEQKANIKRIDLLANARPLHECERQVITEKFVIMLFLLYCFFTLLRLCLLSKRQN